MTRRDHSHSEKGSLDLVARRAVPERTKKTLHSSPRKKSARSPRGHAGAGREGGRDTDQRRRSEEVERRKESNKRIELAPTGKVTPLNLKRKGKTLRTRTEA